MQQTEYDSLKSAGYGTALCTTCREVTDFTHDEQGDIFCVSCGNEAVITEQ